MYTVHFAGTVYSLIYVSATVWFSMHLYVRNVACSRVWGVMCLRGYKGHRVLFTASIATGFHAPPPSLKVPASSVRWENEIIN